MSSEDLRNRVLELLGWSRHGLSATQIADELNVAVARVRGVIAALDAEDLIESNGNVLQLANKG